MRSKILCLSDLNLTGTSEHLKRAPSSLKVGSPYTCTISLNVHFIWAYALNIEALNSASAVKH